MDGPEGKKGGQLNFAHSLMAMGAQKRRRVGN